MCRRRTFDVDFPQQAADAIRIHQTGPEMLGRFGATGDREGQCFLDRSVLCRYFFVRKVLLFKYSYAFVGLPGGLGTLDELNEALTLVQTGKIRNFPIVLIGASYWRPFQAVLREMVLAGTIAPADAAMAFVTDDVSAAMAHIEKHAVEAFGLRRRRIAPSTLLGEPRDRALAAVRLGRLNSGRS